MSIVRKCVQVKPEKWARYRYNLSTNIGPDGERLSGCKEHIALSRKVAQEGMVLLENNGLLPLKEKTKVALFGIGNIDYVKGGGGSGMVYSEYVRDIYEGFACKEPRYSVYEPLKQYYYDTTYEALSECGLDEFFPEIEVPTELVEQASQEADVAIITIHRYSLEAYDRHSEKGDFYLTDIEEKLVSDVTKFFSHCIAILNVGGMVDVSWIKDNPKIDAALLAWQAGMEGGLAIADLLCGDVNPSGKLTDTFARSFADYPSAELFHEDDDYLCYYEDIYVGYRYFETVPGAKEKVVYPFGYGLSYTDFSISKPIAKVVDEHIEVSVTVKNIGARAGKEVVQVYYSAPQGVLGKSKISLAAFQKTKELQPEESQSIILQFNITDMASYDDLGKLQKSAYLLEEGEYRFYVGNNCRDLQETDYQYIVEEDYVVTQQLTQRCAPNQLSRRMLADGSYEEIPSFSHPVLDIPAWKNPEEKPKIEKPYQLIDVAEGRVSLDAFISQITEDELILLMSGIPSRSFANTMGIGGIERLGIPAIMTADGPAGVRILPQVGLATTAWPCATLIACSWEPSLIYEIGRAGGLEAKEHGLAVWLTPALNIHRNPLCGRNFEYFSEDPLVAGKFAAAEVRGIQSAKVASSPKHFACNNKETRRKYSDSRVSERALREIYLRGFEICVKESEPWTIMSSYNMVNGVKTCTNYDLITGILRDEWGFTGMVTSDWHPICYQPGCVLAGNDVRMPDGAPQELKDALDNGEIERGHLEICAKRMMELILKFE